MFNPRGDFVVNIEVVTCVMIQNIDLLILGRDVRRLLCQINHVLYVEKIKN